MSNITNIFNNAVDKILPIGGVVRNFKYAVVFKTTHWCWYNCPHCCENAGAHRPREFMPEGVIKYYIDQAANDPLFCQDFVLTGGEIMASYKFGPENYVPNIMRHAIESGAGVDIKTNGAWVRTPLKKQIIKDFKDIARQYPAHISKYQISLSVDTYHPNAIENNHEIIRELAKCKNGRILVHLSGFNDQTDVMQGFLAKLANDPRLNLVPAMIARQNGNGIPVIAVNDGAVLLRPSADAQLFDGGRAINLPNARHIRHPQFSFMMNDGTILVAFDTMGFVTLGENSGRKIHTTWRNPDGTPRPFADIKRDLIKSARYEEIRQHMIDTKRIFIK